MNNRDFKIAGGAVIILAILCVSVIHSQIATSSSRTTNGEVHSTEGEASAERIARLENDVKALRSLLEHSQEQVPRDLATRNLNRPEEESPEELEARAIQFRQNLESDFNKEAVNPGWANTTRAHLEQSLISTAAEQDDWPVPDSTKMTCRSRTCEIRARYPSEDSAMFGVQLLQSAFSEQFPRTHQYSVAHADGSMTIVMYTSK